MRYLLSALALAVALPLGAQQSSSSVKPRADTLRDAAASGVIDGIVTDTNLVPLRGAFVSILRSSIRVGTGPNGRFRISKVPPGQYLLIVTRGGYSPTSVVVDVPASDTLRLAYTLTPLATMLPGVTVTAQSVSFRMLGFQQRKAQGMGEFLTAEDIDRRGAVFATELLRNMKSFKVTTSRTSSMSEYFALSNREGGSLSMQACPMTVYVDEIPMPTPFNLDLLPSPKQIAGIEVYGGPSTIPPQFSGMNRGCGIIMVWTKDGY